MEKKEENQCFEWLHCERTLTIDNGIVLDLSTMFTICTRKIRISVLLETDRSKRRRPKDKDKNTDKNVNDLHHYECIVNQIR